MRSWWLFVLAGCYRPSTLECTSAAQCAGEDSNVIGDSASDTTDTSMDGAVQPTCVTSTFLSFSTSGLPPVGTSYTRNVSELALFENGGEIFQVESVGASPAQIAFAAMPTQSLTRPSLAALTVNGKPEAFFVQGTRIVKAAKGQGTTWDPPVAVTTNGVTIGPSFVFGQPTATIPRRVVASESGGNMFEGVEANNGDWTFTPLAIPGTTAPLHPNLSRDALSIVFVNQANPVQLFVATRATVGGSFTGPTALVEQPSGSGTESFPSFSHDCTKIFVSLDQLWQLF